MGEAAESSTVGSTDSIVVDKPDKLHLVIVWC